MWISTRYRQEDNKRQQKDILVLFCLLIRSNHVLNQVSSQYYLDLNQVSIQYYLEMFYNVENIVIDKMTHIIESFNFQTLWKCRTILDFLKKKHGIKSTGTFYQLGKTPSFRSAIPQSRNYLLFPPLSFSSFLSPSKKSIFFRLGERHSHSHESHIYPNNSQQNCSTLSCDAI